LHFAAAPEDHPRLSDFAAFGPLRWAKGRFDGSDRRSVHAAANGTAQARKVDRAKAMNAHYVSWFALAQAMSPYPYGSESRMKVIHHAFWLMADCV
jgi:hypothetical protein